MSLIACPGSYFLSSQAEIDAFPTLGCNHITGTLEVSGSDITNLSPLNVIKRIDEYLGLDNLSDAYTTLENVFDGLEETGWGIYFYYDSHIQHLDGFHNLITTGDNIDFWYAASLESVSGFEKLEVAGWSLEFGGNPLLTSIPDFCSLRTVESSLYFIDNDSLTGITGFRALTYVDWSMDIIWNPSFDSAASFCGFAPFYTANAGVYPGGGSNQLLLGDDTPVDPAEINPCGFEPVCPTNAPTSPPSSAPTSAPSPLPTTSPTTYCSSLTRAKDCKSPCDWNGRDKICS